MRNRVVPIGGEGKKKETGRRGTETRRFSIYHLSFLIFHLPGEAVVIGKDNLGGDLRVGVQVSGVGCQVSGKVSSFEFRVTS